ncbi:MAG: hypothetical protein AAFY65_11300 [Pseudomonadota bacterium]
MSAPDTNVEKQAKRHIPSLSGMSFAISVAALAVIALTIWGGLPVEEQPRGPVPVEEDQ